MFPVICKLGPFTIYSYGVMLAIAVVVCAFLMSREAHRWNIPATLVFDLVFWVILGGLLGARLFYVFLYSNFFIQHPLEIMMIHHGGLAWQGGLIGGMAAGLWFIKRKGLSLPRMLDFAAPYAALGQSIGRVGCFLNGCCFGKEAAWGLYFPVHHAFLHPTQLYCSFGLFLIFLVLKWYQKGSRIPGMVFVLYLFLASALRFGVEFFRADHEILSGGLSIYQWLCLGFILGALYAHAYLKRRHQ